MAITKEQRAKAVKKFQRGELDTGSPEVQVALLTLRINDLTEHFKTHKKDVHSQRGLSTLVNQRRTQLNYLKSKDVKRYEKLLEELGLRK